jgi:nitroimidazol reductase NimA-like FMN-containing flavoprotein (pyridoxamine 5'-phosphate oxidase superfamily)
VTVSIKEVVLTGRARLVKDHEEDELARQLLAEKYQKSGDHLVRWLRNSFPVAVDLTA